MDNLGKISASVTATTTAATTTTSTDEVPATTSTRNSNTSAMTTITTASTTSSDQSIEEEIEEAIEISEEHEGEEQITDQKDHSRVTETKSLELTDVGGAVGYRKQPAETSINRLQLFGMETGSESEKVSASGESLNKKSSSDDGQFKIDDDQLSGGKIAQHFVLDDDEEEDDDLDDLDVSLPMEKAKVHSRHDSSDLDIVGDEHKESLTNQSTADDVSDFAEEPHQGEGELDESMSENVELPLQELTQESLLQDRELEKSLNKSDKSSQLSSNKQITTSQLSKTATTCARGTNADVGDSPDHSDKDHSIEEIVETNHSIELTFDDKDLSSLNPSFIQHNETLVNRLLTDTMERAEEEVPRTPKNKMEAFENSTKQPTETDDLRAQENCEKNSNRKVKIITDLDDSNPQLETEVVETSTNYSEKIKLLNTVPLVEAKIVDNTKPRTLETLQVQSEAVASVDTITLVQPRELNILNLGVVSNNSVASSLVLGALKDQTKEHERPTTSQETMLNDDDDEESNNSLELMKLRILAMKHQSSKEQSLSANDGPATEQMVKLMERVSLNEFTKDVLEDITEESERISLSTAEEQQSLSMEKSLSTAKSDGKNLHAEVENIVSMNVLQMLEQKVGDLQNMLSSKDACLAALNLQLETSQRRESSGANSAEQLGSGRDTSSLMTTSTEYRTFQEDFGGATMDIYMELTKRDELIAKLTDSLQQSMNVRENLQSESEKLTVEVQLLRKQLTDAMDTLRRPYWPRADQESNGQRISEISMDLISESDDDLDRQFLTDNEDKYSRNSRERQLSIPRQMENAGETETSDAPWSQAPFSKQIEQFQKYLTPSEVRLFFMVQKKFDDFLSQELEKSKMKYEQELKQIIDQLESEKLEKDSEIKKLQNSSEEKHKLHAKEMEDLRKYFENKCADLEKQYSDDVFSQKSQHHSGNTSSEASDEDQLAEEFITPLLPMRSSKEPSPRKRSRAELLLSPSHRQMTPFGDAFAVDNKDTNANLSIEIAEIKSFYQNKIHELQSLQDEQIRKLGEKLKYYESRYPDDDFMPQTNASQLLSQNVTTNIIDAPISKNIVTATTIANTTVTTLDTLDTRTEPAASITQHVRDANTSLIIIDQDELNINNESQVIQKIIEEYERRLQEQLTLAREDIVHELEQQIQTLLSETTADDQHWPPELILLREKFTAKSQLEIAQLQIKHEEEMSRLKLDYEKQLNRKNKRHSTFDSARDFEQIISERDSLRELSKSFRCVLAELAKCVVNCEDDLNMTVLEEVQRLLAYNRTLEEQQQQQSHNTELNLNLSASLLNASLNCSKQIRLVPDVHNLLEVVEDPSLLQFISNKSGDFSEDFDLKECLERLKTEALYLLQLSEDIGKRHKRLLSESSGAEKNDSCCEGEDGFMKLQQTFEHEHKFMRTNSFNEQHLSTYQATKTSHSQLLSSLPPDLNRIRANYADEYSTPGGNASELNFQVHELKNRLVKSESDRIKLQQELENTISRNAELGQELQALRDQLSQLNSLNHTDYAEGYGNGSIRSPRLSVSDKSAASFAQLQEKARNILSSPTKQQGNNDATVTLLQMIEDFCREGDKVVECNKKDREDLQSQVEHMESQIRELTQKLNESTAKRDKFEMELKASIDKIFVLREIITELETQVETKALNEHVLGEKLKQLEEFINSQSRSNETLQNEVQSLKTEIGEGYQERIRFLEEKLQNIRPSAEQSMVMDQVVEQLRDVESTLDQKTKNLETIHHSISSNSCSISATEDVSVHGRMGDGAVRAKSLKDTIVTPPQGSPVHPSPRQHSLTMEGVQRVIDKLSKHTRVEEAAVKRIHDLEMQVTQMRNACVELQHERDSLQDRMSEQTQRISALQSRLEEQRQRAEELQRAGTSDLNIRLHDLQTEVQNLRETLSVRDKQIATMKQQLEKSKLAIDRLEAELAIEQQPDRSTMERLEGELKQKSIEIQKLKEKVKNEMINKLALPDLMETMLADKNEEIDHLKEQLESKEKELQTALDSSQASLVGGGGGVGAAASAGALSSAAGKDDASTKLSARTLSDILSITEFDEPDVVRRAAANTQESPMLVPEGSGGFLHQTMETSKEAVANLTHKRTDELSGFGPLQAVNTFDHPHYFQDPNMPISIAKSGATITPTPALVPRHINFSALTDDSKLKTPNPFETPENMARTNEKETIDKLRQEVEKLKRELESVAAEREIIKAEKEQELHAMEEELVATQVRLGGLQNKLEQQQQEFASLCKENEKHIELQKEITAKSEEIKQLLKTQEQLKIESSEKSDLLSKNDKNLRNYQENEEKYLKRIAELEAQIMMATQSEVKERETLRKELISLSATHEQCKYTLRDAEARKKEIQMLNEEIKAKDERISALSTKLSLGEKTASDLQSQIGALEREIERLRQQQQNSDNSSKQFSVDEIAQQVEKELNYSAQLDSNILKAIESEEENNLDVKGSSNKETQAQLSKTDTQGGTDDENFTGERELLNQLEALKAQLAVEREQNDEMRQELLAEKQHSQDIQEQDVLIIEAMRKRLETALEKEDELHKQLDMERERCERFQTQLTALQRAESRRNSLLKSPNESPRKSPRSLSDFESELADRLRSELKLLTAQNERERERSADLQRSSDRERQRFDIELQERVEYCEKLKKEMEKLAREKDMSEQECEHLQERLTLQTQEIESLEARLATLQEAETRRATRRDRQQKESAQTLAELQEVKTKVLASEAERESLMKTITQLRFDIERSAQREAKLADALANANLANSAESATVPQQFLQKMKEINALIAENKQEDRQLAETVQSLVAERQQLQKKCEELEAQVGGSVSVAELEERCNHLLGRYLRVESHRKALVYQKRYLKISLQSYQDKEQLALATKYGQHMLQPQRNKRKLFKTVAWAIIAIQRIKYIGRIWHTGKRIVSKSVFTITQQRRSQPPTISCAAVSSTSPAITTTPLQQQRQQQMLQYSPNKLLEPRLGPSLKSPALLRECSAGNSTYDWARAQASYKQ